MTSRRLLPSLALAAAALGVLILAAAPACADDLAPRKGWRLWVAADRLEGSHDPAGAARIPGLSEESGAPWPSSDDARGEVSLAIALPEARKEAILLALEVADEKGDDAAVPVALLGRASGGAAKLEEVARALAEKPGKNRRPGPRAASLILPGGRFAAARLVLGSAGRPAPRIKRLRLYRLDPQGRNDAWLFVGASLSVGAVDPDKMAAELKKRWPAYDPLVVNEAVSGWTAAKVKDALPGFLERHPYARYVCVDVGGNEVTLSRPYPGGADVMKANIAAVLRAARDAGRVPILERLTYRSYKKDGAKGAVPPEENGSLPYVLSVFDPLIAEWCPAFYDKKAGRGRIDLYSWFRDHPEELGGDGIHLKEAGNASFRRIWAEQAGAVVYGDGR